MLQVEPDCSWEYQQHFSVQMYNLGVDRIVEI